MDVPCEDYMHDCALLYNSALLYNRVWCMTNDWMKYQSTLMRYYNVFLYDNVGMGIKTDVTLSASDSAYVY